MIIVNWVADAFLELTVTYRTEEHFRLVVGQVIKAYMIQLK